MGEEGFYEVAVEPLRQFAKDSMHLVKKCTKPDRKQFTAIAKATGVGFAIMGFIGFFVKLSTSLSTTFSLETKDHYVVLALTSVNRPEMSQGYGAFQCARRPVAAPCGHGCVPEGRIPCG
eukprot:CAMPEP_0183296942 /NCGR_PEP_ID=MMETSP0160_2-20130417/4340_1 /TAXON_ID=2839 ORGANISM="Odontella Sinensis, Strain Grunow 1884" /NCGR_SAMPLE_ID=MMETSP0160_2 /ASSEMBLY_ACC=CAM_ASM_000250 /LENGTH=119 /DNA_ID=CAMNT_0025458647 /DNA_START=115 /DNA_END=475 /DNA_ORIENTATION=-